MHWMTPPANAARDRSRLGRILVENRLISEAQLEAAIRAQGASGRRLGEILADMKLITQAQVRGAVRRQRKLRLAAALATALLGPLNVYAAAAGAPAASVSASASAGGFGARPLSEEELGQVTAQGRPDQPPRDGIEALSGELLREQARHAALQAPAGQADAQAARQVLQEGGVRVLGELARVLDPLTMLLSAEVSVSNVGYDPENAQASIGKDGAVTLKVPSTIGEISFHNVRVGSGPGPALGSVAIRDIDLRGTTVTIKPR